MHQEIEEYIAGLVRLPHDYVGLFQFLMLSSFIPFSR